MTVSKETIGNNFYILREVFGIKLEDIGEFVKKSRDTVRNFERGKKGKIDLELAQGYYDYIKKHWDFPKGLKFEDFLNEDLTKRLSEIKPSAFTDLATTVLREKQKTHGLCPGLFELLGDEKLMTLNCLTNDEIEELKKVKFSDDEHPIWANTQFYIEVLYQIRLAKKNQNTLIMENEHDNQ